VINFVLSTIFLLDFRTVPTALYWCFSFYLFIFRSTFRRKKVELLSSLRRQRQRQRLRRLSFRLSFFVRVHFSKTIRGIIIIITRHFYSALYNNTITL